MHPYAVGLEWMIQSWQPCSPTCQTLKRIRILIQHTWKKAGQHYSVKRILNFDSVCQSMTRNMVSSSLVQACYSLSIHKGAYPLNSAFVRTGVCTTLHPLWTERIDASKTICPETFEIKSCFTSNCQFSNRTPDTSGCSNSGTTAPCGYKKPINIRNWTQHKLTIGCVCGRAGYVVSYLRGFQSGVKLGQFWSLFFKDVPSFRILIVTEFW